MQCSYTDSYKVISVEHSRKVFGLTIKLSDKSELVLKLSTTVCVRNGITSLRVSRWTRCYLVPVWYCYAWPGKPREKLEYSLTYMFLSVLYAWVTNLTMCTWHGLKKPSFTVSPILYLLIFIATCQGKSTHYTYTLD